MGKKTGTFTEGQLVYAKVKGYCAWPAKITKVISKHKYGVYFYGTRETGNCKSEELDPYDEKNRARFNTDRQLKKADYKEAVDQIEMALQGNDPAPEFIENNDSSKIEETSQDVSDADPDESQLQIAEDAPKSTPILAAKKKSVAPKKVVASPTIASPIPPSAMPVESETKENDEKVSRSGRKIKEKRINNDEMDPDEVFTNQRKRSKADDNPKTPKPPLNESSAINDFCLSKMHILQDPVRKQFLTTQYEMVKCIQDLKLSLGLDQADVDRSLAFLKSFHEKIAPNITKFMLLKYPNTVVTMKKLRNYIGNYLSWNLEETQLADFQVKASDIRKISEEIYNSFKMHFEALPENMSFWEQFNEEQKQFEEKYSRLEDADLFEATNEEELEMFLNKMTDNDDAQVPQLPTAEVGVN